MRLQQALQGEVLKHQSSQRNSAGSFRQLGIQRQPSLAIKILQRFLRRSLLRAFFVSQGMQKRVAHRIVIFRKTGHPFHHDLGVAQFAQATEERLAQLLHLLPFGIGINRAKAIRHGTAAPNSHAKIVHWISSEVMAGLVAFFQRTLRPVEKPGLLFLWSLNRNHEGT